MSAGTGIPWQAANPQAIATIIAPYMKKIELLSK